MYAVIQSGGKQYRVSPGDRIRVERLPGDVGEEVFFEDVRLVGGDQVQVGAPKVDGTRVVGRILEQGKGAKVLVFKFKRRKMYRRLRGHRQFVTAVQIERIETGMAEAAPSVSRAGAEEPVAEASAQTQAAPQTPETEPAKTPTRKKAATRKKAEE